MSKTPMLLAVGALLLSTGAALAQDFPREPPREYLQAPPADWDHRDHWRTMNEERRREFWAERRRESWRCDHGDRGACHWLHEHDPA